MERLVQAVMHGVPVGVVEVGNFDAAWKNGDHSYT